MQQPAAAKGAAAAQPTEGPLRLTPGFTPDPKVARGVAGGPAAAEAMSPDCAGFVAADPSHVLSLTAPFSSLRILVASEADTTLVVRGPDGGFRCADDVEGDDPIVEGRLPEGTYSVWVGTARPNRTAPYVIGFSEQRELTTRQLAHGP